MSQDPSSQSHYSPPQKKGGYDPGPPSSQFLEARTLPTDPATRHKLEIKKIAKKGVPECRFLPGKWLRYKVKNGLPG